MLWNAVESVELSEVPSLFFVVVVHVNVALDIEK